jgi:hypothetical protein
MKVWELVTLQGKVGLGKVYEVFFLGVQQSGELMKWQIGEKVKGEFVVNW